MTRYRIGETEIVANDPGLQALVEQAYRAKIRPLCLCREPGVSMYIAHFDQTYLVKRMPFSGEAHAPECESYECPASLSGRGEVDGDAIQQQDDGLVHLKLGFSLRRNGVAEIKKEAVEHTSATASGHRLTLRGFLHYLWEESRLNHWVPGMKGKRSWFVIRKYLLQAADSKETKKSPLADILFVPEFSDQHRQQEIVHRRTRKLAPIMGPGNSGKKLMVLVGEVENIGSARFGHALRIKHLNDLPFVLGNDLHKRFQHIFEKTLSLWEYVPDTHLMAIATFTIDLNGIPEVQELAVMLTSPEWLPIENTYDAQLTRLLVDQERGFHKNLRYNLAQDKPIASAILTDVADPPVALYLDLDTLVGKWSTTEDIRELIASSALGSWVWEPKTGVQPPLPPKKARAKVA